MCLFVYMVIIHTVNVIWVSELTLTYMDREGQCILFHFSVSVQL